MTVTSAGAQGLERSARYPPNDETAPLRSEASQGRPCHALPQRTPLKEGAFDDPATRPGKKKFPNGMLT